MAVKKLRFGRLAAWPAGIIDRIYLEEGPGWFSGFWTGFKVRLTYLFLFLPLSITDMLCSFVAAKWYASKATLTADGRQDANTRKANRYNTIFSKNLFATLAFLVGLIFPKLVVFYFTPKKHIEGVEAGGDLYQSDATRKTPETVEELKTIIADAAKEGKKVMPVGAGRSQGKQFLPAGQKGIVVDLAKMKLKKAKDEPGKLKGEMIRFNPVKDGEEPTVTVSAGVCWSTLQHKANKRGLALQVMQASNVFSVGGSIGTNIHGWDHREGTLSNTLVSIDVITAEGKELTLTPKDPLFHQITGGLGMFGIVVNATFKLTQNELLVERGKRVPVEEYADHFYREVLSDPKKRMALGRLSLDKDNLLGELISVTYEREGDQPKVPEKAPVIVAETERGTRTDQIIINMARRSSLVRKKYWDSEVARLLANDSPAITRNEIMQPAINAMFNPSVSESEWLQEYFLPAETLAPFLKELAKILKDNDVALLNASVRFVKQNDDALFSYSRGGDRFAVVLCFNQPLQKHELIKAQKWLREAQQKTLNYGGTFYLPYQEVTSPDQFKDSYPYAAEHALAAKQKADPHGMFVSGVYDKYLAPKEPKPNYFKQLMATKEGQKKFAGFLENVLQRADTKPLYDLLTDILNYKDTHEEIYTELLARISEVKANPLVDFHRTLRSLSTIKEDLGEQAATLLRDVKEIDGLVEIGYPGRFVKGFKDKFKVTGHIAAVHEGESFTDFIQAGIPRPYHQFAKLDYAKPNLGTLKDNSAEVITCYVGLHHFPPEELDTFLQEVRRVLKPGGRFLLVDHDTGRSDNPSVVDEENLAMAHLAHMVFNAVTGVSVEEELKEIRNFQPMTYWQEKLAEHQLCDSKKDLVPMIRKDDPSRNRMVCFVNNKPKPEKRAVLADLISDMTDKEAENAPLLQYDLDDRDAAISRTEVVRSTPSIATVSKLHSAPLWSADDDDLEDDEPVVMDLAQPRKGQAKKK